MNLSRFHVVSAALVALVAAACSHSDPSPSPSSGGCTKNSDCTGEDICMSGACVVPRNPAGPGGSGGSGTAGSGNAGTGTAGSGTAGSGAGGCAAPGKSCTSNGTCCDSGTGIGPEGQLCINDDHVCHAACLTNSECTSGCCATVTGSSYGVCADASHCGTGGTGGSCGSLQPPGGSCVHPSDCCQSSPNAPYGETCISDDYLCHALCTASSECKSACCIKLQGETYGVCGAYQSGYTCL